MKDVEDNIVLRPPSRIVCVCVFACWYIRVCTPYCCSVSSVFPTVPALASECGGRHVYPIARLAGCPSNEKDGLASV